jgi:hypothetical protein
MPVQNSPPYGIYQPRTLNRWLDINSQNGPLRRARYYITIPAFSVDVTWLGYSDIVARFCYEAPNNFSLVGVSIPTATLFVFCISYIDEDNNVFRYTLNYNDNAVFYFDPQPYISQNIYNKFTIEVWSCFIPQ